MCRKNEEAKFVQKRRNFIVQPILCDCWLIPLTRVRSGCQLIIKLPLDASSLAIGRMSLITMRTLQVICCSCFRLTHESRATFEFSMSRDYFLQPTFQMTWAISRAVLTVSTTRPKIPSPEPDAVGPVAS
jgi:hypothetical protein